MTIRQEVREALAALRLDNSPTQEHQAKVDFVKFSGTFRTRTIAERLYRQERLTQCEFNACERWLHSYVLMYDGPGAIQDSRSTSIVKHDSISWLMHMAQQKQSIPEIKETIGVDYHNFLVLSLYHGYSAPALVRFIGMKGDNRGNEQFITRLALKIYQNLAEFYENRKKDL